MDAKEITLMTICDGGIPEVFARELSAVLQNIADPNTDEKKARSITIKIEFAPHPGRTGASTKFSCKPTLLPVKVEASQMYLATHGGEVRAYAVDHRQIAMYPTVDQPVQPITVVK